MGNITLELGQCEQPYVDLSLSEALALGLATRIKKNGNTHILLPCRAERDNWAGLGGLMQLDELRRQQPQEGEK